jgi:sortase A
MTYSVSRSRTAIVEFWLVLAGLTLVTMATTRVVRFEAFQRGLDWFWLLPSPDTAAKPEKLTIPRLGMSVLVVEGDDENSLSVAAGHVSGTARFGERGNAVIAGHRDMAFRGLSYIKPGDEVRIESGRTYRYIVSRTQIVSPEDVSVLKSEDQKELTLVTCYPFDYLGSAPKRFVVQARLLAD